MAKTLSWAEVRAKFLEGAASHPNLRACWDAGLKQWSLEGEVPQAVRDLKATARLAAATLRQSGTTAHYWDSWLDLMRKERRGFQSKGMVPRNGREWRRAMDSEASHSDIPRSEDGYISNVFERSADFCEDLDLLNTVRSEVPSDDLGAISDDLRNILRKYKIESGLRGADAIERSALAAEREGQSPVQRAESLLQERIDYMMDEIERLGRLLLSAIDLTADEKVAVLRDFITGMLAHIRDFYGSNPMMHETVVPRLERAVALWTAHFQREIWNAEKQRSMPDTGKQRGEASGAECDSQVGVRQDHLLEDPADSQSRLGKNLDRSKWKPECKAVVERYEAECKAAGRTVTVASIFEAAGIARKSHSNGYRALRGDRPGCWLKIRRVCTLSKPHLKAEFDHMVRA